jgi:hypothetical protein
MPTIGPTSDKHSHEPVASAQALDGDLLAVLLRTRRLTF